MSYLLPVKDMNGYPLHEGDVVMVHYPNEKIKYLGQIMLTDDTCQFVISNGRGGWRSLNEGKVERLGDVAIYRHFGDLFGRQQMRNAKEVKVFEKDIMERINQFIAS